MAAFLTYCIRVAQVKYINNAFHKKTLKKIYSGFVYTQKNMQLNSCIPHKYEQQRFVCDCFDGNC